MDGPMGKEGGREGWTEKGKGIASYPGPREGPCIHCLHMHSHPTFIHSSSFYTHDTTKPTSVRNKPGNLKAAVASGTTLFDYFCLSS